MNAPKFKIALTHVDLPNESKGGVAHQAHFLANVLTDRGHDVTMFSFSPRWDECRYPVHQYPAARVGKFKPIAFARELARTDFSGFDIVHTHGDNFLMRRIHPHIRTFHGSARDEAATATSLKRKLFQRLLVFLEEWGARVADVTTGVSEATRKRLPQIQHVIANGVDTHAFAPGEKSSHPTLLFVGTTGGRKRGAFLADVFQREIRARFPQAELWAVTEKPLEGAGIVNYGRTPQAKLVELYRRAWVFCLPSTYEGFGVPYIEAMASGTTAVATPNLGAREVLAEGAYGVLAEDAELGAAIVRLFAEPCLRREYEEKGLLRAQMYRWEHIAAQYEALYAETIAAQGHRTVPQSKK